MRKAGRVLFTCLIYHRLVFFYENVADATGSGAKNTNFALVTSRLGSPSPLKDGASEGLSHRPLPSWIEQGYKVSACCRTIALSRRHSHIVPVSAIMKDLAVASASAVVPPVKNGIKPADETGNGEFLQPQFL
jgi:hypothetical protein